MEIGFGALVVLLVVGYFFKENAKQWRDLKLEEAKTGAVEDGIELAEKKKELKTKVDNLGEVPSADDLLEKVMGRK